MDDSVGIARLDAWRVGIEVCDDHGGGDRLPEDSAIDFLDTDEQSMEGMNDDASVPSFAPNAIPGEGFTVYQSMKLVRVFGQFCIGLTEHPQAEGAAADPSDADGREPNKEGDDDRRASAEHQLLPESNQWTFSECLHSWTRSNGWRRSERKYSES